jgi:hypothetical protein
MSEWPGGISGGDYDKRDVPIPEPKIEPDGTYRCSVCNQGFSTRQDYDDHYIKDRTKEKTEKNYAELIQNRNREHPTISGQSSALVVVVLQSQIVK